MSTRPDPESVTRLLREARAGGVGAAQALLPHVYAELHALAHGMFASERQGHILQPTAVIHEAWLKLAGHLGQLEDRRHFFVVASKAMRQVLADHARGVGAQKRGEGRQHVTLSDPMVSAQASDVGLVELDDLLTRLAALHPRHAQVVELRVLGGLTIEETAEALGVSHSTVEADWFTARSWLRTKLRGR